MNKIYCSAKEALENIIQDHTVLAVGGFGVCGIPSALIKQVRDINAKYLTCISNNPGIDGYGLGLLVENKQIKKMIASFVGENKEFERQYLNNEIDVELIPQGTLAEKLRAGGSGIPAFYTRTGVGTLVAEGKEIRFFNDQEYLLEKALKADIALVKAYKADKAGNLIFRKTARNFNPDCAKAGAITVVEVEEIVELGKLDPDEIHLSGIYVDRIILNPNPEKIVQERTIKGAV